MDFWDQDYFRVSKLTSCLVGQWPYQSVKTFMLYRGILLVLVIILLIPRIRAVILHGDDPEVILDATGPFIIHAVCVIKCINNSYNFKKMKRLLNKIRENWKMFSQDELTILHQYTASGKRVSMIYLGAVFGSSFVFVTEPLQLQLVYTFLKTNETPPLFPAPMDYGSLDVGKYYWGLLLLYEITSFLIIIGVIACDMLFFIYSYHIFGLFATLGSIIEHLPIDDDDRESNHIKRCIQIHYRVTEYVITHDYPYLCFNDPLFDRFAEEFEELYIWSFFSVIGLNMMLISITGVQIVLHLDATEKIVQYGSLTIALLGHLFVECLMGQRLVDHSLGIQEHISNAQWYHSSVKTQKMMSLLIMRSQFSCKLTAGKFLVMNFETFSKIIRTSASYFTVLLATQ